MGKFRILPLIVLAALLAGACSTTRRLPEGEILYTGLKDVDINATEGEKFPDDVASELTGAVSVKPNNSLLGSAKIRYPFPLGLWVYNNWPNPPAT